MIESKQKELPYSLDEIRKLAKQSIDQGAVTQDYPLDLNQAYKHFKCCLSHRNHVCFALPAPSNNCERN